MPYSAIVDNETRNPEFNEIDALNNRITTMITPWLDDPTLGLFEPQNQYKAVTTALILAAGDGTRLRPLTIDKPKVMINIWGVPILERLLFNLKKAGISKAVIVVGYKSHVIKNHFGDNWRGVDIIYRDANNYEDGILTSAVLGKEIINERFLLLLGDTIFETDTIKRAMKLTGDLVVGARNERIDESVGAFVDNNNNNRVSAIGMLKDMTQWNRVVTGMAVCEPVFLDAVSECVEKGDYDRPSAMQLMVEKGFYVEAFDMTDDAWWESDDHNDLKKCKNEIFKSAWKRRFTVRDVNVFKRVFNLPISLPLTKLAALTNIRPNHLTAVSLALSLTACAAFVLGQFITGGALCYACAIVDAMDGKISRLKLMESSLGGFFDSIVDRISEVAIAAGLSYGISVKTGSRLPLLIGLFACASWLGRFYLKELFIDKAGLAAWKKLNSGKFDMLGHRDVNFFVAMVSCVMGYPLIPLVLMAVVGNLLAIGNCYKFLNHFRSAEQI